MSEEVVDETADAAQDTEATGPTAADVEKLQKALNAERRRSKGLEAKLAPFAEIDAEALKAFMARPSDEGKGDATERDKFEAQMRRQAEQHEAEKAKWAQDSQSKEARLAKQEVRFERARAMAKSQVASDLIALHLDTVLKPVLNDQGEYDVRVIGEDGNELYSRVSGRTHEYMRADEYLSTVAREKYPEVFPGSGQSGSGSAGSQRSGSGARTVSAADFDAMGQNIEAIASGKVRVSR